MMNIADFLFERNYHVVDDSVRNWFPFFPFVLSVLLAVFAMRVAMMSMTRMASMHMIDGYFSQPQKQVIFSKHDSLRSIFHVSLVQNTSRLVEIREGPAMATFW